MAEVVEKTDRLCPKREQGLTTGEYLAVAAVNRAMRPVSKRSMWDWFSRTALLRHIFRASKTALSSQRFWDHMDRIGEDKAISIWRGLLRGVVERERLDLSSVCYDGTNFYTFIDTFNARCELARRGKNKQGRSNLRQVSYALFCSADGHIPLFYDVYDGSRNDAKQFPVMLGKFHAFLRELAGQDCATPETTLVFDKGNNSKDNFAFFDSLKPEPGFVGSVKVSEHKELAGISNNDPAFNPCEAAGLEGTKAFRVKKKVYGKEKTLVVTYNQNLFNAQWLTVQNDIVRAMEKLGVLREKLEDRANGILKRGATPSTASIEKQCKAILSRQHMKELIKFNVREDLRKIPRLEYRHDPEALRDLSDTCLGKNILITNRHEWDDEQIIKAYRSQFIIEDVFKEMKDRDIGSWWPLNHWTTSKIRVHGLYCTTALLLRALMLRRVRSNGLDISMKRLLRELDSIHEVVNVYPRKRREKTQRRQSVLSRMSELQQRLVTILELQKEESRLLG
jgi:transposase